jgi:hypothetical protein
MGRSRNVLLLIPVVACLLVVAACGGTSSAAVAPTVTSPPSKTTTTATSKTTATSATSATSYTAACNGVAQVNQSLTTLSDVNPNTTVGDVKTAQAKVTAQVAVIKPLIPAAETGVVSEISAANTQLSAQIAGYPNQTLISKTSVNVAGVKSTVATAQTKTNNLNSMLNCKSK